MLQKGKADRAVNLYLLVFHLGSAVQEMVT